MAASQNSSRSFVAPFKKPSATRRVWTRPEEAVLLDALKDLVVNGWRADNAFRPGYLGQLETAMAIKFPHARITGEKHINSKLTVWKKTYGQLSGICGTSGFGFDSENNMIEVESDDVWDNYVRVHRDVQSFRYKSFPYYEDWKFIFGNDRANGRGAQQIADAILDLEHPHDIVDEVYDIHVVSGAKGKGAANDTNIDHNLVDEAISQGNATPAFAPNGGDNNTTQQTKKRKAREGPAIPEQLITFLGTLFDKTNGTLGEMAERVVASNAPPPPPPSPPNKTKMVFDIVNAMVHLPMQLRILVAHKIINNQQNTDLFLTMDEQCRMMFVDMIVTGTLDSGGGAGHCQ